MIGIRVIIPSHRREYRIADMVRPWIENAKMYDDESKDLQVWVACESEDLDHYREALQPLGDKVVIAAANYGCYVEAVNQVAYQCGGEVMVVAADDVKPCKDYDRKIVKAFQDYYPDFDGVLKGADLIHGLDEVSNTHPVVGRNYYNKFGYIYYPAYFALWCDTDFAHTASLTERTTTISDLVLEHLHHSIGKTPRDITHEKPLGHNDCGLRIFEQRKREGFPAFVDGKFVAPKDLFRKEDK